MEIHQFEAPEQVRAYSEFRQCPPPDLLRIVLAYLGEEVPDFFQTVDALDVGCGSGQSTEILCGFFKNVLGVDVSSTQVKEAILNRQYPNVKYKVASADSLPVLDKSVHLLTAGTCFHWLNTESFFKEAKRVLAPGGVLAVYSSPAVYPVADESEKTFFLEQLTNKILYEDMKPYRSPRVMQLFEKYENTTFPFDDVIRNSKISRTYVSTVAAGAGYIRSMSTFQNFRKVSPQKADCLLQDYQNSIIEVLGVNTDPENTPLTFRQDYFLILCRKSKRRERYVR